MLTPELEQAFDTVSKGFDGVYFGRYDVRVTSIDDFVRGRDLGVIELNGVTSEATHIYDPKVGLLEAYRALFEQWRLAFEIGAENVAPYPRCGGRLRPVALIEEPRVSRRILFHLVLSTEVPGPAQALACAAHTVRCRGRVPHRRHPRFGKSGCRAPCKITTSRAVMPSAPAGPVRVSTL